MAAHAGERLGKAEYFTAKNNEKVRVKRRDDSEMPELRWRYL